MTTKECKLDGAVEAGALFQVADTDEGFGDALYEIATSADSGRALGARGQSWARRMFDWESVTRRVDASYRKLIPLAPTAH